MDRISAYGLLSAELDRWRRCPRSTAVDLLGKPPHVTSGTIDDVSISIEVSVTWADAHRTKLRVSAVAYGPSHWKMERQEESIILSLVDVS